MTDQPPKKLEELEPCLHQGLLRIFVSFLRQERKYWIAPLIVLIGLYISMTNLVVVVTTAASLVGLIFRSLLSVAFGQFLSHGVTLAMTCSSLLVGLILIFLAPRVADFVLRFANLDGDEAQKIGNLHGAAIISVSLLGLFLVAQNLGASSVAPLSFSERQSEALDQLYPIPKT